MNILQLFECSELSESINLLFFNKLLVLQANIPLFLLLLSNRKNRIDEPLLKRFTQLNAQQLSTIFKMVCRTDEAFTVI